jgi:subtilase family serine protease
VQRAAVSGIAAAAFAAAPAPALGIDVALPLRADLPGVERFALAVNTPGSPQYGRYQSVEALARRFGALPSTRSRVLSYFRANGATDVGIDPTGLFARATVSVGLAERIFQTSLARRRTAADGSFLTPSMQPRIPAPLRGLVGGVIGLDTRPLRSSVRPVSDEGAARPRAQAAAGQPASALHRTGTPRGCPQGTRTGGFTPNQYLTAYGVKLLHRAGLTGHGERVALIEIDGLRGSDVRTFGRCFGIHIPPLNAYGVGIRKALRPGGEATLDTEILSVAAPGLKSIDIYQSKPLAVDVLGSLIAPLRNRGKRPNVVSASLGLCERDELTALGVSGIRQSEGVFALAAASGFTYVAASGDSGSSACTNQNGVPRYELGISYPASSWYVAGVGGTNFALSSANRITAEIAWNDLGLLPLPAAGGGGSSALFTQPPYQSPLGVRRRETPDVSLLSDVVPGYAIHCSARPDCIHRGHSSSWRTVGGTSAATPLLAGAVALIDQRLRRRHRRDAGLINTMLYRAGRSTAGGRIFRDVVAYGNDVGQFIPGGTGSQLGCCTAAPGFDMASGWGSVDFWQLSNYALTVAPRRR